MDFTPVAGFSSAPSQFNIVDEEDDNQPTPRMPPKAIPSPSSSYGPNFDFGASTSSATPSDTPAARLRALLARSSDSPNGKYSHTRSFAPPVEAGTGIVPSRFTPATPIIIRDSLKDLFSHARREPGDTPQKSRPRRSSFDSSEMDITPVVSREREQHKGKRKSLSDDEVDKPSAPFPLNPSFLLSQHVPKNRARGLNLHFDLHMQQHLIPFVHASCLPARSSWMSGYPQRYMMVRSSHYH